MNYGAKTHGFIRGWGLRGTLIWYREYLIEFGKLVQRVG